MSLQEGNYVVLDFETYSAANLKKTGTGPYFEDAHYRPLIGTVLVVQDEQAGWINRLDFIDDPMHARKMLVDSGITSGLPLVAHNALFEWNVLNKLGITLDLSQLYDTAVLARAMGAHGSLAKAAPQLTDGFKLPDGDRLIKLFSVPSAKQREQGQLEFDTNLLYEHADDWLVFKEYCDQDVRATYELIKHWHYLSDREWYNSQLTMQMNLNGWTVDEENLELFSSIYQDNLEELETTFRAAHQEPDLNFNSSTQMIKWAKARGVNATSFDKNHVEKMIKAITKRLAGGVPPAQDAKLRQVLDLLLLKQELGGSSLKKLETIQNQMTTGALLKDQYLHIGAGQSYRTSGRGVQMQNLKRLGQDTLDLNDPNWGIDLVTNEQLAASMRKLFVSRFKDGQLVVGDYSSVESRGLAYLAGAEWKLAAFRRGEDIYKTNVAKQRGISVDEVDKAARQYGKVGELSCGYQAGGQAVKDFAEGMGVELTLAEANTVVTDWRNINVEIVRLWEQLDRMLREVLTKYTRNNMFHLVTHDLPHDDLTLIVRGIAAPASLQGQTKNGALSILVTIVKPFSNAPIVKRVFHGCYYKQNSIVYHKPSGAKTGPLWKDWYTHPKTKRRTNHTIYGGKLSGILTQSFCRELFFEGLANVQQDVQGYASKGMFLVGQFHDEIVLDVESKWVPLTRVLLERHMSKTDIAPSFPLAAEVDSHYRYIK